MTNTEKWNLIVKDYNTLYSALESKIQVMWEQYCPALFNYQKLFNEVDSQRHLSVGSGNTLIPDIILRIDDKDVFDIELKQYNSVYNENYEKQLISYLNQTHIPVGMIVCQKIYLYYYEYATFTINKIEIPFEIDNKDGVMLMELLNKDSFSVEKIKNFVLDKITHDNNIKEIKRILLPEFIKNCVKDKLLEKYPFEDVEKSLQDFYFTNPVKNTNTTEHSTSLPTKNPVSQTNDIRLIFRNWIASKTLNGEISSSCHKSDKGHIRFTTQDLDDFLPYHHGLRSGWGYGIFYAYEIVIKNNSFKIWLCFSNQNAPPSIRNVFKKIMNLTNLAPKKDDWQWWAIFTTNSFSFNNDTTPEMFFNALNSQFDDIKQKVNRLIERLKNLD